MTAANERIEPLITRLVQSAPVLDADVVAALIAELATCRGDRAPLAGAIAACVELVAAGTIDAGISLPHLAMACASLVAEDVETSVLAAVQYEIATLMPVPNARPRPIEPDVPLTALRRR